MTGVFVGKTRGEEEVMASDSRRSLSSCGLNVPENTSGVKGGLARTSVVRNHMCDTAGIRAGENCATSKERRSTASLFFTGALRWDARSCASGYVRTPTNEVEVSEHTAECKMVRMPSTSVASKAIAMMHERCTWRPRRR